MASAGLVVRTNDPLRIKRSLLDVADPFLRFHYSIIRPNRAALARHRSSEVWSRSIQTFRTQVLGTHFESVCREAVLDFDLNLPTVANVGATLLSDPDSKVTHEIDVVGTDAAGKIVLIGVAKASTAPRGAEIVERLDYMTHLIPANHRAPRVHRAIFAMNGADCFLASILTFRQ